MSEQNREHLAFVAVMNALDVHMPPDGAALLTELRAIAATVGYPWRGTPPTAGPVAPPPETLTPYQADRVSEWRCAQHSMMCECHPGREWPHDECPGPGMPWIIEGRTLIEEVLAARSPASLPALEAYRALVAWLLGENGEFPREPALLATRQRFWWRTELRARQRAIEAALAVPPRGAARPPQPPEQAMTTNGEVHCALCGVDIRFIDGEWLDRETHSTCNLRVVGGPLKHGPHPVARPPARAGGGINQDRIQKRKLNDGTK